eukprot:1590517-Pleurochrysis_carterae.AAC.1
MTVVVVKDAQARNPAVPMPLRRRRKGGQQGDDPRPCAYDALRAAWDAHVEQVPPAERTPGRVSARPFFTDEGGVEAWTSATSRRLA